MPTFAYLYAADCRLGDVLDKRIGLDAINTVLVL